MPKQGIHWTGKLPNQEFILAEVEAGRDPYLDHIYASCTRAKAALKQDSSYYTEKHHIVPKHAGGSDDPSNLVDLGYNDHVIAHWIRWVVVHDECDYGAFQLMINQPEEGRRAIAVAAGKKGGKVAQERNRERGEGRFSSELQSQRGQRSAAVNRANGTGAYDPANLQKANQQAQHLYATDPAFRAKTLETLAQGRQTQINNKTNIGDPLAQRLKSLKIKGYLDICGYRYYLDEEQRTHISDGTLRYY